MHHPNRILNGLFCLSVSLLSLSARAQQTPDSRDADRSWHVKIDDSGPGQPHGEQPLLVVANDGTWVCAWTAGQYEGAADQHITSKISTDKGKTWSSFIDIEPVSDRISSYSYLYKVPSGRIYCFYRYNVNGSKLNRPDHQGDAFFRFSDDNGRSWSKQRYLIPTRLTSIDDPQGEHAGWFCGQGPVRIGNDLWLPFAKNDVTAVGTSFDRTESWFWKSPNILTEKDPAKITWTLLPEGNQGVTYAGATVGEEPALVALSNGSLYTVFRANGGFLGSAYSTNEGRSWSAGRAAQYADGGGDVHNPRGGASLVRLADGTYFMTFYNDRSHSYDSGSGNRTPLWGTVGWEEGNELRWAQPEILLYNDRTSQGSAEGHRKELHAPQLFETDGSVFMAYSNKKTDIQLHRIPHPFIEGLKAQRTARTVTTRGLVTQLDSTGFPQNKTDLKLTIKPLHQNGSVAFDLWVDVTDTSANQALLDSRNKSGTGLVAYVGPQGTLLVDLTDADGSFQSIRSGNGALLPGRHHVVINLDGASDVATLLIDGRLSGNNPTSPISPRGCFAELSHDLGDINSDMPLFVGKNIFNGLSLQGPFRGKVLSLRVYDHYLTTSEAIANFRAGQPQPLTTDRKTGK